MPSFVYFVIIGIVLAILSPWREGLFDLGGTVWNITIGLIARFFLLAMFAFVLWGLWIFICWLVASRINSPVAGIVFGTLSPVWVIMSIIAIYKGQEEDEKGITWVGIILLIATLILAFSYYFPTLGKAMANYSSKSEIELANDINKRALQKEPEGFLPVKALEDSVLYDDRGIPKGTIGVKKGEELRTMSLTEVQFRGRSEFFVEVMRKNSNGHFHAGENGYLPVSILDFGDGAKKNTDKNFWEGVQKEISENYLTPKKQPTATTGTIKMTAPKALRKVGEIEITEDSPADLGKITGGKFLPEGKKYWAFPEGMGPESNFLIPGLHLRFYSGKPGNWTDVPIKNPFILDIAGLMVSGIGAERGWRGKIWIYEEA